MLFFDIFKGDNFNKNEFFEINGINFNPRQNTTKYNITKKKYIYKYYSFLVIIVINYITFSSIKLDIKEPIVEKNFDDECREIQRFMYLAKNNILIDKGISLNKYISKNPKLSIVIPIYNGEKYIKQALTSIQNQDLKDIEIILVDDCSIDKSVKIIKEYMKNDPRIKLYINKKNEGILYTKSKGINYSKGKYIILLDEDDIFGQRDAFSTLYQLAEKDDLDMLGFASMFTESQDRLGTFIHHYYKTPIILKPNISKLSHDFTPNGKVKRKGDNIWCYIFKNEIFNKTISLINKRFLNTKMICHEDYLILFLITRIANKFRQIKRIFHIKITYGKPALYITKSLDNNKINLFCQSYLNYIEFILIKTNNTFTDKKIASYELERYFLNKTECKNNTFVRKRAIKVCKAFLKNEYIERYVKMKILSFLHEYNVNLSKYRDKN